MEIKPCKNCLNYDDCMKKHSKDVDDYPYFPVNLKNRIYNIFVEGWDCFIKIWE